MNLPLKNINRTILLFLMTGSVFAAHARMVPEVVPGKVYLGLFGGGGSTRDANVTQFGTAFYLEAAGGPLAVNAFGHTNSESAWFWGAQVGYQAQDRMLYPQFYIAPAIELEGFSFNNKSFNGELLNNTARLPEHDFIVHYNVSRNVFLTNFILNFNNPCYVIHPYIGAGIGGAIVRITGAEATQVSPPEVGVNHYNSNTSDTSPTFAGQIKAGLSYDINRCFSVFAEYRWLYIANTRYQFGSTVYAGHPETSSWDVKMDPQRSNLGAIGVRFNM